MIKLEITTKVGKFIFETLDKSIISSYKHLSELKFTDQRGKLVTLFGPILQTATVRMLA